MVPHPPSSFPNRRTKSILLRPPRQHGELATALHCEIRSLGYPSAALFAFGVGVVAYNILSVVRTALAAAHGEHSVEDISAYYVADEIRGMMRGMMVAIRTIAGSDNSPH